MDVKRTVLLFLAFCCCAGAPAQTVDEIIAKHITFTGGAAHWKNVQTIITSGTYNYGGIAFPFTAYSKRPDRYKFVVPLKGKYFAQAFDGKQGWKIDAFKGETKKTILTGAPARAMANEADVELEPLFISYNEKGHQAVMEGSDTVNGTVCFKIKLIRNTGETETYFFDCSTYALLKKTAVSKNAELEGAALDTYYSDYRPVKNIRIPFKAVSKTNGQTILTILIKKVELNTAIPNAAFK